MDVWGIARASTGIGDDLRTALAQVMSTKQPQNQPLEHEMVKQAIFVV